MFQIGLDVGSTTIKCVVLDSQGDVCYQSYERHFSQIVIKTKALLGKLKDTILNGQTCSLAISGSAGMGMANTHHIPFIQEVFATKKAAQRLAPDTDVIIELGGEDAKILFLQGQLEVRMNGSCAGGTGAFIDQMSTLLQVPPDKLNTLSESASKSYPIASRCGVFAKSDIQPLLNQGAEKSDLALSIFDAVCNQTIVGLAQGRKIEGNILYLGGPLSFLSGLRASFDKTLHLQGILPKDSLYYVAIGTASLATQQTDLNDLLIELAKPQASKVIETTEPLFKSEQEYTDFSNRHSKARVDFIDINTYSGKAYLGIDAGSTTLKCVLISEQDEILDTMYCASGGNVLSLVKDYLINIYTQYPDIQLAGSATTGYGEEMLLQAFQLDTGIVETFAHLKAAQAFKKDVDFIIDIGGQDMKCFKIKNNSIENIFLNEACSAGCGSFLQTFAEALNTNIKDFAKKGLLAKAPVELGSRCTVFMNSSVKQAQKDGATIEDISAGLALSVVKNAIYKVIRPNSVEDLGKHIIVQGGTFYNDAVLRAFEKEMGTEVIRPNIAGLMGAYGCALHARSLNLMHTNTLQLEQLQHFQHTVSHKTCKLCQNLCQLTLNHFDQGREFITGNRCENPITQKKRSDTLNMFEQKRRLLAKYKSNKGSRGKIGIPLGLNMYELLPFWATLFAKLDFAVVNSGLSTHKLYLNGQSSVPSDTVCFPAKLMHGHIMKLIRRRVDTIFYPCMGYNLDEGLADNNYNCPVVGFYPEVIDANIPELRDVTFIKDYLGLHNKRHFKKSFPKLLRQYYPDIPVKEIREAIESAYEALDDYQNQVVAIGEQLIEEARNKNMQIIVLAGRPYHIDPEISHGIDLLINGYNVCVITEDVIAALHGKKPQLNILNQWTYHARLYAASEYVSQYDDMDLVQLVSFGCGCDAVTADECRSILEDNNKIYTQLKIDEVTNLGAVKIRLRSLFQAKLEKQPLDDQHKTNAKEILARFDLNTSKIVEVA